MSNKLVKNDKSKRMERIDKLIKEYATEVFLGWKFIIRQKGDGYFVGTARESAKGYSLCVLCYVEKLCKISNGIIRKSINQGKI